jgi:hypothetical protein
MWYKDQAAIRWTHFRVINWKSLNKSEMSHQRKGGGGDEPEPIVLFPV